VPFIVLYQREIAQLFDAHPDSFLFRDLPGAGAALAPRLLSAFGSDRERFKSAAELCTFSGIAPVRIASGKTGGKNPARKASIHFRCACPKFLRQSFHELVFTRSIEHENENDYEPRFVPRTRTQLRQGFVGQAEFEDGYIMRTKTPRPRNTHIPSKPRRDACTLEIVPRMARARIRTIARAASCHRRCPQ
jgi:Transposase IS116/IS110/IS902 family